MRMRTVLIAVIALAVVILKPQILVTLIIALAAAFFLFFIWALLFGPSIFTK
jgi:hypothetical protein